MRLPFKEDAKKVAKYLATIFGLKSLTLSQCMHPKQGLHGLDSVIYILCIPVNGEKGISTLYYILRELLNKEGKQKWWLPYLACNLALDK